MFKAKRVILIAIMLVLAAAAPAMAGLSWSH